MAFTTGRVGTVPALLNSGGEVPLSMDSTSALRATDAHARYQDALLRGNVYHAATAAAGVTLVAANASPLAAGTGIPIIGIFNPAGSGKYALIWFLDISHVSGTVVAGGLLWNLGAPNQPITAALTVPTNLLTYQQTGSVMKASVNQALTGSLAGVAGPLITGLTPFGGAVAATTANIGGTFEYAGRLIVPPGAYLGVASAASSTEVVAAGLTWEEVAA